MNTPQTYIKEEIEGRILDVLITQKPTPEEGVAAIMNAVVNVLHAVATATGNEPKAFIKDILKQTSEQI